MMKNSKKEMTSKMKRLLNKVMIMRMRMMTKRKVKSKTKLNLLMSSQFKYRYSINHNLRDRQLRMEVKLIKFLRLTTQHKSYNTPKSSHRQSTAQRMSDIVIRIY